MSKRGPPISSVSLTWALVRMRSQAPPPHPAVPSEVTHTQEVAVWTKPYSSGFTQCNTAPCSSSECVSLLLSGLRGAVGWRLPGELQPVGPALAGASAARALTPLEEPASSTIHGLESSILSLAWPPSRSA